MPSDISLLEFTYKWWLRPFVVGTLTISSDKMGIVVCSVTTCSNAFRVHLKYLCEIGSIFVFTVLDYSSGSEFLGNTTWVVG